MRNVTASLIGIALLGAAGGIIWKVVLPRLDTGSHRKAPPSTTGLKGLPPELLSRLKRAGPYEVADILRTARERYSLPSQRSELAQIRVERLAAAKIHAQRQVDTFVEDLRYRDAIAEAARYRRAWRRKVDALEAGVRNAQREQIDARIAETDALVDDGRYQAARESLLVPDGLFEESEQKRLADHRATIDRRIRIRSYEPSRHAPVIEGDANNKAATGHPSPPPALPGHPHQDVRRLAEARTLHARAAKLFAASHYAQLAEAADQLVGYFGDLKFVSRRIDGLRAVRAYARYKTLGFKGLFHATKVVRRGKTITLTYTFATPDEHFDWEEMKVIPHADSGQFDEAKGGARGTGVIGYVNRAFFEGDVLLECDAVLQAPRSHGIGFLQAGREQRQVLLLATNHWFTEGENYVKKRPGQSILLIGKGVNNDVPIDSPEVGFVFKGPSVSDPRPGPGAQIHELIEILGQNVRAEVSYRGNSGKLRVAARGDDGRGFERHRPALYVVQAGVTFKNVKIRGRVHPDFANEREQELLDEIDSALAETP